MASTTGNGALSPAEWNSEAPAPLEGRAVTGAELTPRVRTYLETAPGSLFAGHSVEAIHAWDGGENLLWRVHVQGLAGAAVLKLFTDAGLARGRRAADAHERFAPLGLAPNLYWFDRAPEALPQPLLVYGWADGAALAEVADTPTERLAQAVATLHTSSTEGLSRFSTQPPTLETWLRLMHAAAPLVEPWLAGYPGAPAAAFARLARHALATAKDALPLWANAPLALVHGDLRPEHILVRADGTLFFLDWENCGLGDPARELARLATLGGFDAAIADLLLAANPLPGLAARFAVWQTLTPFELLLDGLVSLRSETLHAPAAARAEVADLMAAIHRHAARLLGLDADEPLDYTPLLADVP